MPGFPASTARASYLRIALAVLCAAAVALAGSLPSRTADAASSIGLFPVAAGLAYPLFAGDAGDGSGRLFIVEQRGIIRIMQGGAQRPIPFLDIRSSVLDDGSEQGLLGLAFHPSFASNGRFYVAYTALNGNDVVAEYRLSSDPNRANPGSRRILINQPDPYPNHNGGHLAFGPDKYLYIGMGDGGSAGDPQGNGQRLSTLLGKIL